jgi:hypothetical protein
MPGRLPWANALLLGPSGALPLLSCWSLKRCKTSLNLHPCAAAPFMDLASPLTHNPCKVLTLELQQQASAQGTLPYNPLRIH